MSSINNKSSFTQLLLAGLISGSVLSTMLGFIGLKYAESVKGEISRNIEMSLIEYKKDREWEQKSLVVLFAPLDVNLERSKRSFDRWQGYVEQQDFEIIQVTNNRVRKLLLDNYHLIPSHLQEDASTLIEYYDVWLQQYSKPNVSDYNPELVYRTPKEERQFPLESVERLRKHFRILHSKLITDIKY